MINNAGQFVKKLLLCKHNKANDNLIQGNHKLYDKALKQIGKVNAEYVKWGDK